MLRVINIEPDTTGSEIDFTADTTLVSADTTLYTADQTVINTGQGSGGYNLVVPYRFFKEDVKFYMINELDYTEFYKELSAYDIENGSLVIRFSYDFEDGDSFESTIRDMDDNLMWRGRIFSTDQTDLQNYDIYPPIGNVIKI